MNTFEYRIYYKYVGASKDDPFATRPLPLDKVQHYLDGLRSTLPQHFSATAKDYSLFVTVVTDDSEQETDSALERYVVNLNRATSGLSLLIDKLRDKKTG